VRFHSKPAKGKPEASRMRMLPATVRLSKFFKDVFVLIARYPLAIVTDRNGDTVSRALQVYPNRSIRACEFQHVERPGIGQAT